MTASLQLPTDLESSSAQDVLRLCLDSFPGRVALACSFQKEESVLLDMLFALDPAARAQRQHRLVQALRGLLPAHALLWQAEETTPYECDGLSAYRARPLAVALPETEAQVAAVLRCCLELEVPVVARGAGTGLSGGALPHPDGLVLSLARLNQNG